MQMLTLDGVRQLSIRNGPVPDIEDHEILVRVRACTISRRDLDRYVGITSGRGGEGFGGEVAGTVQRAGSGVTQFAAGDRVAVWGVSCGFSEYIAVPEDYAMAIPAGVSYEEGAIAQMLPSIVYSLERCDMEQPSVFVSGTGAAGLLSVQAARCAGASALYAAEMHPFRLRRAMELGVDRGINAATEEVASRILEETSGRGVDLCMECAGEEGSFRNCEEALATSGMLVVVGTLQKPLVVNFDDWQQRSLRLVMATTPSALWRSLLRKSLDLIAGGAIVLRPLLTHVFPLHRASEAFTLLIDQPNRAIKVSLAP
ncbi:MAG: zinc-binding dehydrogenase [candidate division Zixibacteria bacterium]|nr:zinc-binding dehydrogenase [candidate division Zixibacteria bacterium]